MSCFVDSAPILCRFQRQTSCRLHADFQTSDLKEHRWAHLRLPLRPDRAQTVQAAAGAAKIAPEVIDSSDRERIDEAQEELMKMLQKDEMKDPKTRENTTDHWTSVGPKTVKQTWICRKFIGFVDLDLNSEKLPETAG